VYVIKLRNDPCGQKLFKSIKQAFDPNNILNPGKMGLPEF